MTQSRFTEIVDYSGCHLLQLNLRHAHDPRSCISCQRLASTHLSPSNVYLTHWCQVVIDVTLQMPFPHSYLLLKFIYISTYSRGRGSKALFDPMFPKFIYMYATPSVKMHLFRLSWWPLRKSTLQITRIICIKGNIWFQQFKIWST